MFRPKASFLVAGLLLLSAPVFAVQYDCLRTTHDGNARLGAPTYMIDTDNEILLQIPQHMGTHNPPPQPFQYSLTKITDAVYTADRANDTIHVIILPGTKAILVFSDSSISQCNQK